MIFLKRSFWSLLSACYVSVVQMEVRHFNFFIFLDCIVKMFFRESKLTNNGLMAYCFVQQINFHLYNFTAI
jgi:hypothetical protein